MRPINDEPRPAPALKIVSGGQTGVDRAALDAAIALGWQHGGWCPRGRLAEDGAIPERYRLVETESRQYAARTERNVVDSDATLILARGPLAGGTELTRQFCRRHRRPHRVVDLDRPTPPVELAEWLRREGVAVLNVAGPRESQCPGIGAEAERYLREVFAAWLAAAGSRDL